jgi:hypothetical protein
MSAPQKAFSLEATYADCVGNRCASVVHESSSKGDLLEALDLCIQSALAINTELSQRITQRKEVASKPAKPVKKKAAKKKKARRKRKV